MRYDPRNPDRRPNVLVILTDDQRYDTINALGNREIYTPNMDSLVENGLAFVNGHIMGGSHPAICMPSRAMLLTGRDAFSLERCGYAIPEAHTTLGEAFRRSGYHTIGIGKWHNGTASYARGFTDGDEILFAGMEDHWHVPLCHFRSDGDYPLAKPFRTQLHIGREKEVVDRSYDHIYDGRHSSEIFADAAAAMVRKYETAAEPFLMYLATMAPHDPRTMPQKYLDMYDPDKISLPENYLPEHPFDKGDMKLRDEYLAPFPRTPDSVRRELRTYYAMITHLDAQLGRVLEALRETGQMENTVIAFAGDNGLAIGSHGLMGKQNLYEHSIRVPLILSGPGIPRGETRQETAFLNQVFPTLCDLAGVPVPETVQFKSLLPLTHGERAGEEEASFFLYTNYARAVKQAPYKLIEYLVDGKRVTQLFDLETDPWEMNNLYPNPECAPVVAKLRAILLERQKAYNDPMAGMFADYERPAPVAGRWAPPQKMKAVVCHAIFDYALDDAPMPEPEAGGRLARVEASAVTPADRLAYSGSPRFWGNGDPAAFMIPPVVPLGEFVARIGGGADERVVVESVVPCGHCRFCERGMFAHCQQQSTFGFMTGRNGSAAEYVALPANARLHRVPGGMDDKTALLAYDVAQAARCTRMARLKQDDLIVLACEGALGLAVVRCIAKGPRKSLIVLSEDEGCLRAALELGADVAVNPARAAVLRDKRMMLLPGEFDILRHTQGYGCDVFINTSRTEKSVALGLELLSGAGRYVECAVFGGWTYADWSLVCAQKELTVLGVKRGAGNLGEAIASLAEDGALVRALRFGEYGRENWQKAFEAPLGATEKRLLRID